MIISLLQKINASVIYLQLFIFIGHFKQGYISKLVKGSAQSGQETEAKWVQHRMTTKKAK
ncbi:hypothetical protein [Prevotella aurantiaca]|uniref:hypothetical protein n=1 Tax=Prevotella aurantiaca TaxID=596085 RepID=UPI00046847D8|nr:hypothetical protein [Prevotella aurantiaca]